MLDQMDKDLHKINRESHCLRNSIKGLDNRVLGDFIWNASIHSMRIVSSYKAKTFIEIEKDCTQRLFF